MDGAKKLVVFLIIIAVIVLGGLFLACKARAMGGKMIFGTEKAVDFIDICRGQASTGPPIGKFGYQLFVFQNVSEWERNKAHFFSFSHTTAEKTAMLDTMDFSRQTLLIFTLGATSGTGYAIDVQRISIYGGKTRFYLTSENPPPDQPEVEVMSHPIHMVLVNKADLTGEFEFYMDNQKAEFETTTFNGEP